jgi:hypothetical protein
LPPVVANLVEKQLIVSSISARNFNPSSYELAAALGIRYRRKNRDNLDRDASSRWNRYRDRDRWIAPTDHFSRCLISLEIYRAMQTMPAVGITHVKPYR